MSRYLIFAFCLAGFFANAQSYVSERKLAAVPADGFYRINLSPEVIPAANAALSNVRITDVQGREVPYVIRQEAPTRYSSIFMPYRIHRYAKNEGCCSTLVLENPNGHPINNIHLSIRNADVSKPMILTGSDDGENWYAVKDRSVLSASVHEQNTSTIRLIDFPLTNYAFYKIDIGDSTSAPLNILAAGYYEMNAEEAKYVPVPMKWHQSDSAGLKRSYVELQFEETQVVDRIVLSMKGSPYFLRKGWLLQKTVTGNGRAKPHLQRITSFTVSSRQPAVIELPGIRGNAFVLEIENEDNPVLQTAEVRVDQLNRYLVAWLKQGEAYALKFGAADLRAPNYDLENFRDSIPAQLTVLTPGPTQAITQPLNPESTTIFTNRAVIWIALVVVIGILGFMAVRMAREIK